jgi:hypothetical protein
MHSLTRPAQLSAEQRRAVLTHTLAVTRRPAKEGLAKLTA